MANGYERGIVKIGTGGLFIEPSSPCAHVLSVSLLIFAGRRFAASKDGSS